MDKKQAQLQALERLRKGVVKEAKRQTRARPFLITLSVPAHLHADTAADLTHATTLQRLDGLGEDAEMAEYIDPNEPIAKLSLSGGDLRLRHDARGLRLESRYRAPKELSQKQLDALIEFTRGQWSDGAGENFAPTLPDGLAGTVSIDWQAQVTASVSESALSPEETAQREEQARRTTAEANARIDASKARVTKKP